MHLRYCEDNLHVYETSSSVGLASRLDELLWSYRRLQRWPHRASMLSSNRSHSLYVSLCVATD